jgi:thiamine-phosphate diphosphorylase/hydroxyethylthiazole kinase
VPAEYEEAKRLLPKDAIIGISTSSIEEAKKAITDGADYLGIGTMFATPTYISLPKCSLDIH